MMAVVFASEASAQDDFDYRRFLPLDTGNQWEYASWRDGEPIDRYTQLIVVGDTTIEGRRFAKVEQTMFDVTGLPVDETTCALHVGNAPDYDVEHVEVDGECYIPHCRLNLFNMRFSALNQVSPGSFRVGWRSYDADMVGRRGDGACHRNFCDTSWIYVASDVGAYECWGGQDQYVPGEGIRTIYSRSQLIFARIGASTYGEEWLRGDAKSLDDESQLEFETYPNPFAHSLTLEFKRSDSPVGALHVELYDLLGRELLEMPARREVERRLVLDEEISGFSPGIYLLRMQTDDGRGWTRKVTKVF